MLQTWYTKLLLCSYTTTHTSQFTINNLSLSKKSALKNLIDLNAKFRVTQEVVTSYMDIKYQQLLNSQKQTANSQSLITCVHTTDCKIVSTFKSIREVSVQLAAEVDQQNIFDSNRGKILQGS